MKNCKIGSSLLLVDIGGIAFYTIKDIVKGALNKGVVLYNGEQKFDVRNVRIFNPLRVENIWETLTADL